VPDFALGLRLLEEAVQNGHGDVPMLEIYSAEQTPRSILAMSGIPEHNRTRQTSKIEPLLAQIKAEWSLRDEDLIRVPSIHRLDNESLLPNMVNAVVLNGHLLMSHPRGPIVNGKDLFHEYMRNALKGLPLELHFLDDRQYHKWSGNVHCATNVVRDGFEPSWWKLTK